MAVVAKKKNGRPPHEPTDAERKVVMALKANGLTHEQVADYMRLSPNTLRLHYKEELKIAFNTVLGAISGRLVQEAMAGNGWAVCFWLKTRAGWKETVKLEHEGSVGLDSVSDEELLERQARLQQMEEARNRGASGSGRTVAPKVP